MGKGPGLSMPSAVLFSLQTPTKMALVLLWEVIIHCLKQPFRSIQKLKTNKMLLNHYAKRALIYG